MSRPRRNFQPGLCYHISTRCNNREFRLTRLECREVFLYAIKKAQQKYGFKRNITGFVRNIDRKQSLRREIIGVVAFCHR